jgi:hypothetical protein
MDGSRVRSQFEMTERAAVDEASDWLRDLGFRVDVNKGAALRPGRQQLTVFHGAADTANVRRIVLLVDPRAVERRSSTARGAGH